MSTTDIDSRLAEIGNSLYRISVKAVILNREGKLLCVQEDEEMWWTLPGGGLEYGEDYQLALQRELAEELSVDPKDIRIEPQILFTANQEVYSHLPRVQLHYCVHP